MCAAQEKWTRPESVPYPRVWKRFDGLRPLKDGKIPKFRVEDVTPGMHEDVINFMLKYLHRPDGSLFWKYFKLTEDPLAVKEYRMRLKKALEYNISVVAFQEGAEEDGKPLMVGCNIHGIAYKNNPEQPLVFTSPILKTAQHILDYACSQVDVYEKYDVDKYITALGLLVHPEFRGQGLGEQILNARLNIGRSVGLKLTVTVFNGLAAQKLGNKLGMEFLAEIPYSFFKDEEGNQVYPQDTEVDSMVIVAAPL